MLPSTMSSTVSRLVTTRLPLSKRFSTLHVYDHCPYCIRVDLFCGWNNIKYERKLWGYGDVEGPVRLTGKKQLPVLEYYDHETKENVCLPESLDIINHLMRTTDTIASFPVATEREALKIWEKKHKVAVNDLTRSRILKMPAKLVDFATERDRKYAIDKYTKSGFSYAAAEAREEEAMKECEESLQEFEELFLGSSSASTNNVLSLHGGSEYGMDDVIYLPNLRKLTCVKDLNIPKRVREYIVTGCNNANLKMYDDWAL